MPNDNGNNEVLEAIQELATQVDNGFEAVNKRFGLVDKQFERIDVRFDEVKSELRAEIQGVEQRLSSKIDHVDKKVDRVAEKLLIKGIVSEDDAREIITLEPQGEQGQAVA